MAGSENGHTTAAVEHFLHELAGADGNSSASPIVRALLARSVNRLQLLCANLLYRSYPRLARPPLNLRTEELVSAVVGRLLRSLDNIRPQTVRQFFALANQHMRWELNDLARQLDEERLKDGLPEALAAVHASSESGLSNDARRMLAAIESLPEAEREVFDLVRIQGIAQSEVSRIVGVSAKTIQRRLHRSLILLEEALADLRPTRPGNVDT